MNSFPLADARSDLDEQIRILRGTKAGRAGAARVTIARYPDFRVHLITLGAGVSIPWHANPGQVSVRCVGGLIRIHTASGEYQLPAGEVLMLGRGVGHDVEALRESALVVAIACAAPCDGITQRPPPNSAGTSASGRRICMVNHSITSAWHLV